MKKNIYRAKSVLSDQWIYGDVFRERNVAGDLRIFIRDVEKDEYYLIKPETICENLFKSDNDNIELFSGDIISFEDCNAHSDENGFELITFINSGAIIWNDNSLGYEVTNTQETTLEDILECGFNIIGNIYDSLK